MKFSKPLGYLLLGLALLLALVAVMVFRARQFQTNRNAFEDSLRQLASDDRFRIERLVRTETSGMTRNEEKGIVYYQGAAKTGSVNRIYLLWLLAEGRDAEALLKSVGARTDGSTGVGMAVYADLGFHAFRSQYGMSLARMLKDRGFQTIRGSVYVWNAEYSNWRAMGRADGMGIEQLLTPDQRREILRGTFNRVCASGTGGDR